MFEVISRTLAAFIGMFITMFIMVYIGKAPSLDTAFSWLEEVRTDTGREALRPHTAQLTDVFTLQGVIILLFGMMIIVMCISKTGVFEWVGVKAYSLCRNKMWLLVCYATFPCVAEP